MEPPFPPGLEVCVFGTGCFWGTEKGFWRLPGVFTTAVGYAGGYTPNPTYEEVCSGRTGHTEVVLAVYDPAETSYGEMLRIFWEGHDPTQGMRQGNDVGTQYRSAIYCADEAQKAENALEPPSAAGQKPPQHDEQADQEQDHGADDVSSAHVSILAARHRAAGAAARWKAAADCKVVRSARTLARRGPRVRKLSSQDEMRRA